MTQSEQQQGQKKKLPINLLCKSRVKSKRKDSSGNLLWNQSPSHYFIHTMNLMEWLCFRFHWKADCFHRQCFFRTAFRQYCIRCGLFLAKRLNSIRLSDCNLEPISILWTFFTVLHHFVHMLLFLHSPNSAWKDRAYNALFSFFAKIVETMVLLNESQTSTFQLNALNSFDTVF